MIVSLTEAKSHLRVDQSAEDALITLYIEASEDHIKAYLNRSVPGIADSPQTVPAAIKAAALLIVGDLYENREGGGEKDIKRNPAVDNLLYPYRVGIGI